MLDVSRPRRKGDGSRLRCTGAGRPVQIVQVGSERAEAEAIVRRIRGAVDKGERAYKDFAVLYRTNAQSRAIEEVFVHHGMPYRIVGGVRFYERKEIKDIIKAQGLPEDKTALRVGSKKALRPSKACGTRASFPVPSCLKRKRRPM